MALAAQVSFLPVGDPTRRRLGLATRAALWTAVVFVLYLWIAKEVRPVYSRVPWQDDPYDAVVSFAFFFVPILGALCLMRAALCKRAHPLPVRRAHELLLASRLMLYVTAATVTSEWLSVALGAHRSTWNALTWVVLLALGLVTVAVIGSAVLVSLALRSVPRTDSGPDWWSDATTLVGDSLDARGTIGGIISPVLKTLIDRLATATRKAPIVVAILLALGFGISLATTQALAEEGFAPTVFLIYGSVASASMFAFVVIVGRHLRLADAARPMPGRVRRLIDSLVAAAAAFVGALAFRDVLQPVMRLVPGRGPAHALEGFAVIALIVFALIFAGESALGLHREGRPA